MSDHLVSKAVAKTKLRLVALRDGAPPYDAPFDGTVSAAMVRREQCAVNLRKSIALICRNAEKSVERPLNVLTLAYADKEMWGVGMDQLSSAIDALQTLRVELQRRVPK